MNSPETKPSLDEKMQCMGKKDSMFNYVSKWPLYTLHTLDQDCIWLSLKTKLDILEYQKILQELPIDEIEKFLDDNPDIAFETDFFEDVMPDYFFFKYKDQIYVYTTGKKGKDKVRIYARFYFNLEEIINC